MNQNDAALLTLRIAMWASLTNANIFLLHDRVWLGCVMAGITFVCMLLIVLRTAGWDWRRR